DWSDAKLVWSGDLARAGGSVPPGPERRMWAVAVRGVLHNSFGPIRETFTSGLYSLDLDGSIQGVNLQKIGISAFNDLRDLLVDGAAPLCGVMVSSINEHQWEANAHRCVETAIAEGRAARYVSISYAI